MALPPAKTVEEWLIQEGAVPSFKYDEDTGERILVYTLPPLKNDDDGEGPQWLGPH